MMTTELEKSIAQEMDRWHWKVKVKVQQGDAQALRDWHHLIDELPLERAIVTARVLDLSTNPGNHVPRKLSRFLPPLIRAVIPNLETWGSLLAPSIDLIAVPLPVQWRDDVTETDFPCFTFQLDQEYGAFMSEQVALHINKLIPFHPSYIRWIGTDQDGYFTVGVKQ